jgi:hypothetical protein
MVFEPMMTAVQNVRAVLTPNRLVTMMIAAGHHHQQQLQSSKIASTIMTNAEIAFLGETNFLVVTKTSK